MHKYVHIFLLFEKIEINALHISRSKSSEKVSNDKTQKYLFFDIADFDNTIVRTMLKKWKRNPWRGKMDLQLRS